MFLQLFIYIYINIYIYIFEVIRQFLKYIFQVIRQLSIYIFEVIRQLFIYISEVFHQFFKYIFEVNIHEKRNSNSNKLFVLISFVALSVHDTVSCYSFIAAYIQWEILPNRNESNIFSCATQSFFSNFLQVRDACWWQQYCFCLPDMLATQNIFKFVFYRQPNSKDSPDSISLMIVNSTLFL